MSGNEETLDKIEVDITGRKPFGELHVDSECPLKIKSRSAVKVKLITNETWQIEVPFCLSSLLFHDLPVVKMLLELTSNIRNTKYKFPDYICHKF